MSPTFIKAHLLTAWKRICNGCPTFLDLRQNQRGQAIIEYTLMLVVIVGLAYGLARAFFTPLRNYGSSVFTNTIACSLEYGQLPSRIVGEEGCSASMTPGQLGTSPGGGGSGGAGRGGSGGSSANQFQNGKTGSRANENSQKQAEAQGSGDKDKNVTNQSLADGTGSKDNQGGGSVTVVDSRGNIVRSSGNLGAEGKSGRRDEIVYDANETGADEGDYAVGGSRNRLRRRITKGLSGQEEEFVEKTKSKEKRSEKVLAKAGVDGGLGGPVKRKRIEVSVKNERKPTNVGEPEWDLAQMFRVGMIILMILAIVIFVFFQVSQIRKNSGVES